MNEMITQLPTVGSANLSDIIYAVQGYVSPASPGTSVQESLQQVFNLVLSNTILHNAGNPNGAVAGNTFQLCWDTTHQVMYVCVTSGTSSTAVWVDISPGSSLISPTDGGTGLSNPTAHSILIAEGASNFNPVLLTNGQVLIGSTGLDPVAATLTAGPGISIANGAGSVTISGTASGIGWTDVTGATQAMVADSGYTANRSSLVTFTLPATAAYGTGLAVVGKGTGGWTIAQNVGQNIQIGSLSSTIGAGGSVSSTNQFDSINLVCTTANTTWTVLGGVQGNLTIV
jgi:hypothetical protein